MEKIIELLELIYQQGRYDSIELCSDIGDSESVLTCGNEDRCSRYKYCVDDLRIKTLLKELKSEKNTLD